MLAGMAVFLAGWTAHTQNGLTPPGNMDFEVCDAALSTRPGQWVLQKDTASDDRFKESVSYLGKEKYEMPFPAEVGSNLLNRNSKSVSLEGYNPRRKTTLVSKKELDAIFKERTWDSFYKRFKGYEGLITLSLPGYNRDRTLAALYIDDRSGGLSGAGDILLLEKRKGGWKVKWEYGIWIS